jgi:Fe-S oxidoreductase
VALMDTGCCGMAGTFGYEAEHYELSMKVGELKLFPRIRGLTSSASGYDPENATGTQQNQLRLGGGGKGVVSSGAACRMQIKQGTSVEAMHPIMLVARQVREWKSHAE